MRYDLVQAHGAAWIDAGVFRYHELSARYLCQYVGVQRPPGGPPGAGGGQDSGNATEGEVRMTS